MSATPRTDAFEATLKSWCGDEAACLAFARQLEVELEEAHKSANDWRNAELAALSRASAAKRAQQYALDSLRDQAALHALARLNAIEECAKVCDAYWLNQEQRAARAPNTSDTAFELRKGQGGTECAAAVRALASKPRQQHEPKPSESKFIEAARCADWEQVVRNGGPPCFHIEGDRFCLRALRWEGHNHSLVHTYIALHELFTQRWGGA